MQDSDGKLFGPRDAVYDSLTEHANSAEADGNPRDARKILATRDVACAYLSVGIEILEALVEIDRSLDNIKTRLIR